MVAGGIPFIGVPGCPSISTIVTRVGGLPGDVMFSTSTVTGRMRGPGNAGVIILNTTSGCLNVSVRGLRSTMHDGFNHGNRTVMGTGVSTLHTNHTITSGWSLTRPGGGSAFPFVKGISFFVSAVGYSW